MINPRLAKKGNVAILNAMLGERRPLSIKEAAEVAGISLSTAHAAITLLVKENVVKKIPAKPFPRFELDYSRVIPDWAQFDRGVFLVNVLGIVYDPKQGRILIGRRENDPHLKELSWCFPGGRPSYDADLEEYVRHKVKEKTNLKVGEERVIFAKTYPEKREFLSVYYVCAANAGCEKPMNGFVELKWVKPTEVKRYFTTSLHPRIYEFLRKLEESGKAPSHA
ncbi:NUDIX domain-containing protein [Candidatus Micrarchaeota archaeon]|nr:NUDIX domain-containing protein [Candidatus Micrarchaeota archaeon]